MNNLLDYMVYQNDYSTSKNLTSDYIKKSDEDKEIINLLRESEESYEKIPDNLDDILIVRDKKRLDYLEHLMLVQTKVIKLEHNDSYIYVLFR